MSHPSAANTAPSLPVMACPCCSSQRIWSEGTVVTVHDCGIGASQTTIRQDGMVEQTGTMWTEEDGVVQITRNAMHCMECHHPFAVVVRVHLGGPPKVTVEWEFGR